MTIKEFSQKYGVPYRIVYESTYLCKPCSSVLRDKEYNEQDLLRAVMSVIDGRMSKQRKVLDETIAMRDRLIGVCGYGT